MFTALTGGIGCGKSTALELFAQYFECADADKLCHEYYTTPAGIAEVAQRWPAAVDADGQINRKILGNIVFRDERALQTLEDLIAPFLLEKLASYRQQQAVVIVEIPLLFEKKLDVMCDSVISVWSPFALRRARLAQRNWDHAECARRERLQYSPEEKLARADYGIINTGSLDMLAEQCRLIAEKLKKQNKTVIAVQ